MKTKNTKSVKVVNEIVKPKVYCYGCTHLGVINDTCCAFGMLTDTFSHRVNIAGDSAIINANNDCDAFEANTESVTVSLTVAEDSVKTVNKSWLAKIKSLFHRTICE